MRDGWPKRHLADVLEIHRRSVTPSSMPKCVLLYSIPGLDSGKVPEEVPRDSIGSNKYLVSQPSVLVSLLNPRIPRHTVAVAGSYCSTEFAVMVPRGDEVELGYLALLASSEPFQAVLTASAKGTTGSRSRSKAIDVLNMVMPIPPLEEQRRIVDLIGALDGTIAATRRTLKQTLAVLSHFPASLIARGLAESWNEDSLGNVLGGQQAIRTGPFGSQLHKSDYRDDGPVAVVMPADMKNGRVLRNKAAKISQHDADRLARHITREGDILWSRRGDVTRFAVIDAESAGSLCGTGCFHLRPNNPADAKWLEVLLSAPETGRWLIDRAVGATMANLNRSILGAIPVLVPPEDERNRLVASWAGLRTMEQQLLKVLDHLHVLRSNVLTALLSGEHEIPTSYDAVMGELVPAGL